MDTKSHKYELCVLEGMQQGSRQPLRTAQAHSVGNSFDCDIYLHDMSETNYKLEILPGKLNIAATLVSGAAVLDNKPLLIGQKNKLPAGVPVRLGDNLFTVEGTLQTQDINPVVGLEYARKRPTEADQLNANDTGDMGLSEISISSGTISRFLQPRLLLVLIGCGLVGSGIAAWSAAPQSLENTAKELSLKNHVLQADVDGDVSVVSNDEGVYSVNGWLSTREEERKLSRALQQRSEDVVINTSITADVEASVANVFRTHGLQAEISSLKPGKLVVRTRTANLDLLLQAENAAKTDVHGLEELSVFNTKPELIQDKAAKAFPLDHTDKNIQLVVVGDPSYVVADNHALYFTGSVLPTGHRIDSIFKDKIVVTKNGKTSEMKL